MQNFPIPDNQDNLGATIKFWFAPVDDVASIDEAINQLISSLTFKPTKDWYEGYAIPGSLFPSEPPTETESGTIYKCSLKGSYPKESPEATSFFEELRQSRYIVAFQDGNNQFKLMGTLDKGCRFRYTLSKDNSTNQYDFEFYLDSSKPLFFIASTQIQ